MRSVTAPLVLGRPVFSHSFRNRTRTRRAPTKTLLIGFAMALVAPSPASARAPPGYEPIIKPAFPWEYFTERRSS